MALSAGYDGGFGGPLPHPTSQCRVCSRPGTGAERNGFEWHRTARVLSVKRVFGRVSTGEERGPKGFNSPLAHQIQRFLSPVGQDGLAFMIVKETPTL